MDRLAGRTPRVCLVGTAPPRRCGIATFTDDLRAGLVALDPPTPAVQIALTDSGSTYAYGPDVVFDIQASQLSDYRTAAEFIEHSDVDVVCVQHEFGIFGGPAGRYVRDLLDHAHAPVVTTLHTVLPDPPAELLAATRMVAERSDRLVVMAERAVELLVEEYGIDRDAVAMIPHGVPDVAFADPRSAKAAIGVDEDRTMLMTFGLLGPDKGIEDVIDALPAVVADHPDVVYIVLGATHPEIRRQHGEAYREALQAQVARLGLDDHVVFENRYVPLDELCRYLAATDLYVTPYHGVSQIVSGTLAYAVGMGCGVVSTPYPYARELLADGRGRIVPFRDPAALGRALADLVGDDATRQQMRRRAFAHGSSMTWSAVARAYTELFAEVIADHEGRPVPVAAPDMPQANFAHLRALTDDTGLFQHAVHGVTNRAFGYCTDDAGRALVAAVRGAAYRDDPVAAALVPHYLSFLGSAARDDGRFENLLGYDRRFVADTASEDTLGQAIWGLGSVVELSSEPGLRAFAGELLEASLGAVDALTDTKASAYAVCGCAAYLQRYPGALAVRRTLERLTEQLADRLAERRRPGWEWFDEELTYANAKVPEAMLLAGRARDREDWCHAGLASLDFLLAATYVDGRFDFVGNAGWYPRGERRAVYGQQPIEAGYTAEACMLAYETTGDARYLAMAESAVEWLLGRNRLGQVLYDPTTGRCADGLDRHGASANAGAESAVCALLGLLAVPRPVPSEQLVDDRGDDRGAVAPAD